jgi:hypothetical protein
LREIWSTDIVEDIQPSSSPNDDAETTAYGGLTPNYVPAFIRELSTFFILQNWLRPEPALGLFVANKLFEKTTPIQKPICPLQKRTGAFLLKPVRMFCDEYRYVV